MLSFYKKSVHSFLGLTNFPVNNNNYEMEYSPSCKFSNGLGLIAASSNKTPNILESSSVKSPSSPPPSSFPTPPLQHKTDPGGIGFLDDIGGGVNGLMSCTESLGFESSDERRVDNNDIEFSETSSSLSHKIKWRKVGEKREVKNFPPPLPSLNRHGQPSFFLRPVRKNGRLELTEVRIDRPEILRASREDGRLRLHLIRDEDEDEDEDGDEDEEQEEQEEEEYQGQKQEMVKEENDGEKEEDRVDEEERGKFPVSGEGFRRCHELVLPHDHHHHHHHHHHHSNHHHNLQVWSQHCVTTR